VRYRITVEQDGETKLASVQYTSVGARRALKMARRRAALYGHGPVRCTPPLPERAS
jgi:hypothetical protein